MRIGSVTADDAVQIVTLVVSLLGIIIFVYWLRYSGRPGYAIAPLSYFFHRITFYLALMIWPDLPNADVVMWSSALSLHSVLTLLIGGVAMLSLARLSVRRA